MYHFNNRPIQNVEVEDVCAGDCPEFSDAYISYAEWADTGVALTDEELNELSQTEIVAEAAYQSLI